MAHIDTVQTTIQKRKTTIKRRKSEPKGVVIQRVPVRLSKNAEVVLKTRYLKKNELQEVTERPEDLYGRVAHTLSNIEKTWNTPQYKIEEYETKFFNLMATGDYMPNSPTLMNAGREMGMLSACFVLPVEDSIEGIFSSIKNTAMIQKAGGGTGFDFSRLRPAGDFVKSSGGTSPGPLCFLKVFSDASDAIQQGAFRRGANMGMLRIDHPDIIDFIKYKEDLSKITNFNISVNMTNEFMDTLKKDPNSIHYVVNPRTKERTKLKKKGTTNEFWKVGEIFSEIIRRAHSTGEPGLCFTDKVNETNTTPHIGQMEATNPCGEQPLLPYEACNLGSINLANFVDGEGARAKFNWDRFKDVIRTTTRFLDNVVEANDYPIPEIREMCHGNRKIGLGVMGFADALYKLHIPYNSDGAVEFGEATMKFMNDESHSYSEELAEERGCFPYWKGSIWEKQGRKMRNACTTTVAPTGTISIIANCSGGIEPLFSVAFFRNVLNGKKLIEVNDEFKRVAKDEGFYSEALMERVAKEGTLKNCPEVPEKWKKIFVCAHDIQPEWHVKIQAAFQKHCDAAISKTINFSHDAPVEDVEKIYRMAYDMNCKGVTIYRDGCRQNQPMALDNAKEAEPKVPSQKSANTTPMKLNEIMPSLRIRQQTPFGNMHVKISVDPKSGMEREVFAQLGRGGDLANSDLEGICRMLSLFLRCNGSFELAIRQLEGIGSSLQIPTKDGRVISLPDSLAKALQKYYVAKKAHGLRALLLGEVDIHSAPTKPTEAPQEKKFNGHSTVGFDAFKIRCPECDDGQLWYAEGCMKCYQCGYSQC